jgi:hypothetical protein
MRSDASINYLAPLSICKYDDTGHYHTLFCGPLEGHINQRAARYE